LLKSHREWRDRRQRFKYPIDGTGHLVPHVVERLELRLGLDEWEEHSELRAVHLLEEATEDVVVVEEVLSIGPLVCFERALELLEEEVELLHYEGPGTWRLDARDLKDDLQPLLDVELHV